ncbi:glycerol channel [Linderina pennispora]|nr:glycerol channel [Linderina pennispora]
MSTGENKHSSLPLDSIESGKSGLTSEGPPKLAVGEEESNMYPMPTNIFKRFLYVFNAEVAEFFALAIFIFLGSAIDTQIILRQPDSASTHDLSMGLGWGCAVIGAVVMSCASSGSHINPAMTVSLAVFGHFPWRRVPTMIVAQFLGCFFGAFLNWLYYFPAWDLFDGGHRRSLGPQGTALAFIVQPSVEGVYTNANLFFNEALMTFILLFFIYFVIDKRMTLSATTAALLIGLFVTAIVMAGDQYVADTALNPARDFGPRVFIFIAGYRDIFKVHNHFFFVPLIAPFVGGIAARGVYDYLIVSEEDKPKSIRKVYWNK